MKRPRLVLQFPVCVGLCHLALAQSFVPSLASGLSAVKVGVVAWRLFALIPFLLVPFSLTSKVFLVDAGVAYRAWHPERYSVRHPHSM